MRIVAPVFVLLVALSGSALGAGEQRPEGQALSENPPSRKEPRADKRKLDGFWKAIRKADAAFGSGSTQSAIDSYKSAIEQAPSHPTGYQRLGAALASGGELDEAIAALSSALRFSSNPLQRAQILFLQATIADNAGDLPVAEVRWRAYLEHVAKQGTQKPAAVGKETVPARSAEERLKRIEARARQLVEYAVVRQRIIRRKRELDVQAR